jgi:hypothetical protein
MALCSVVGAGRRITTLMMEAIISSETSAIIYQTTRCYIPEDSRLHICRRENHKSHQEDTGFV